MSSHVHEWDIQTVSDGPFGSEATDITADCECGEMLSWDEINRRVNATERLSGRMAEVVIEAAGDRLGTMMTEPLRAYTATLEEE